MGVINFPRSQIYSCIQCHHPLFHPCPLIASFPPLLLPCSSLPTSTSSSRLFAPSADETDAVLNRCKGLSTILLSSFSCYCSPLDPLLLFYWHSRASLLPVSHSFQPQHRPAPAVQERTSAAETAECERHALSHHRTLQQHLDGLLDPSRHAVFAVLRSRQDSVANDSVGARRASVFFICHFASTAGTRY